MTETRAELFRSLVERKARAELKTLQPLLLRMPGGDVPADVLVLAGRCEVSAGAEAVAPEVAEAVLKAVAALGWEGPTCFACMEAKDGGLLDPATSAMLVEVVDPDLVLALDGDAAGALAVASGLERLVEGRPGRVAGRVLLALSDFAGSLADDASKRRVWEQLKSIRRN